MVTAGIIRTVRRLTLLDLRCACANRLSPRGLSPQLDEDTLNDLTYAFLATDLDHGGTLEPEEVQNLLQVIGGGSEIDLEECRKIMKEAKVSAFSLSLVLLFSGCL